MDTIEKIKKRILAAEKGKKSPKGRLNILLFYPNSYSIAITSLAFHRIYELISNINEVGIKRCFLEGVEEKELLILDDDNGLNLSDIDIVAFFLSYEMDFFNLVKALKLLKIPFFATERNERHPLVIGGGVAVTENPEAVADFFDVLFIGEAEESLPPFINLFFETINRNEILEAASCITGVYIPQKVKFYYNDDGTIAKIDGPFVKKGVYENFAKDFAKTLFMTQLGEFGDTFLIELTRGCPGGCYFCISRTLYNPLRFADKDAVLALIKEQKEAQKFGLLGASVSFHPHIKEIMETILMTGKKFSISSLRVEKIDRDLIKLLKKGGSKTITIAPEMGREEMRKVINKGIREEQIENAIKLALDEGIEKLKLYFMIGFPFEDKEDIEAIIKFSRLIRHLENLNKKRFVKVSFNISPFVPKPFTPFQWASFENLASLKNKINYLRKTLVSEKINMHYDVPKWSYLEAVLSRGDRRVRKILMKGETTKSFGKANINPDFYALRERGEDELFPWDFIDIGIPKEAFLKEWQKINGKKVN